MGAFKRLAAAVLACAAVTALACVDMSAPKGPASISLLQLPALYVVLGDTMRDTNGVIGVPSIISFNASGDSTLATGAQFFPTDSAPVATFDAAGALVGNALGQVHLIGQIGKLQTPAVTVSVTSAPDSLANTTAPGDTLRAVASTDSAASSGTVILNTVVFAADQTTVQGVFVTYTLTPHSSTQSYPALFLTDGTTTGSTLTDTTKAGGTSTRTVVVIAAALPVAVRAGQPDSAIVTISAKYKGAPLKNAPLVLKIPIKVSIPTG